MRKINPEHIKVIIDLINQGPYFKLLSMEVCELRLGYSKVEVTLDNKHLTPFGGIHGGVYSSLIDTAAYWAIYCDVDEEAGYVSIDVNVDFLSTTNNGHLIVEGKRIKSGHSIYLAEAIIKNSQGKYLTHGTSKLMVTPGVQTISQIAVFLGYKALPPKYII
jgi:uncharacterized protein (TIGR00369 family)